MNKKIIIIAFSLALFILLDFVLILPSQVSQLNNDRKESLKIRKSIKSLQEDLSNKQKFVQEKNQLVATLKKSQTKFVSQEDASFIMAEINRIAKELNLNLVSIQPKGLRKKSSRKNTEFYYLPFVIQLDVGYHDLGRFLYRIENLDFSLVLQELLVQGVYPDTRITLELCGVIKK